MFFVVLLSRLYGDFPLLIFFLGPAHATFFTDSGDRKPDSIRIIILQFDLFIMNHEFVALWGLGSCAGFWMPNISNFLSVGFVN